jgi:phage-related protein
MVGMEQEQDAGETFNAVAPYVVSGDAIVYLPEYYVRPTNPPTQALKIRAVDFTASFPTAPTEAELRQAAREWIDAARPWIPTSNIKIDFVALWQTEQYKNVAAIQRVGLCDTVSIYYTDLGIVAEKAKIIRTVFDVLTERFAEIEVGTPQTQFVEVTGDASAAGTAVLPEYIVESVYGATQSVGAGANYTGSFDCTKANYKPLAIAGFSANSAACSFARLNLNGTTITFNMRNNTSTASSAKPEVWVVYQRI